MPQAELVPTPTGLSPKGEGWFVVNTRDAAWKTTKEFGSWCGFEGTHGVKFPLYGINIHLLEPGKPNCMYHAEEDQESFLVLEGECLAIIEGQEVPLKQWDFVHCPSMTRHVFVGIGNRRCALLCVGGRVTHGVVYPVDPVAAKHNACVKQETTTPAEAYPGVNWTTSCPAPWPAT